MDDSLIGRGRERLRKTINETIKNDLDFIDLAIDVIYDMT